MVLINEKNKFDEMSRAKIATPQDNLPFEITVQSPEHDPPHALLLEKNSKTKERGEFLIPSRPPKFTSDIQDFRKGISDKDREIIFRWINQKSKRMPKLTNWEMLVLLWELAVDQ
jgi:hypothetical protein